MKELFAAMAVVMTMWLGFGCDGDENDWVARIDDYTIGRAEMAAAASRVYGSGTALCGLDSVQLRRLARALIARQLLTREAVSRGLKQSPRTQAELADFRRKLLADSLRSELFSALPQVTETAMRELYQEWGKGEEIRGAHIQVATPEKAETILQQLESGTDFAQLARRHSLHRLSAYRGGDMGWMRAKMLPPALRGTMWEMEAGQVHPEPLRTGFGYHVVKVVDRRRVELEEQREALVHALRQRRQQEAEQALRESLAVRYKLQWHAAAALELSRLELARNVAPADRPLYSWQSDSLTLADFVRRSPSADRALRDTAVIHRQALALVHEDLLAREAEAQGHAERPSIARALKRQREQVLGQALEARIAASIKPREAGRYFDAHRERYRDPMHLTIREILVADSTLAAKLRRRAAQEQLAALARQYTEREGLRERGGLWEDVSPTDPRSAEIHRLGRHSNGLVGPVKVPGGYSIFVVEDRRPGDPLEWGEAASQVYRDLQSERMETLIDSLRRAPNRRIEIHLDRACPGD